MATKTTKRKPKYSVPPAIIPSATSSTAKGSDLTLHHAANLQKIQNMMN